MRALVSVFVALLITVPALGTTVNNITRIKANGGSTLRGFGLVMGLDGSGDSGKDLAMARALAEVYRNNGMVLEDITELAKSRSVAVVSVTCQIPPFNAFVNDRFDVTVTVVHSAETLEGGELYLTVLQGPTKGAEPFAVASGPIELDNPQHGTRGRVRMGAQLIRDIRMQEITDGFVLVLDANKAGHSAAAEVAAAINTEYFNAPTSDDRKIATAFNEREIHIRIPEVERANTAAFIASIKATPINVDLLRLPAQVIINEAAGIIQVTGNVEITPGVITAEGLTVTTTVPAPEPTSDDPLIERTRWTRIGTGASQRQNARLTDLLDALNRLDVATEKQIKILYMLEKNGQLHGKIIKE